MGTKHRQFSPTGSYVDLVSVSCWSVRQEMSGFFKISSAPVVVTITLDKGGIVNSIYECLIVEDTITLDKGGIV